MTVNPTTLLTRIARAIKAESGVWFGPMDIASALARGLCGQRLAPGQPVSMILVLRKSDGLKATPGRLPAVAAALNVCGDTDRVTEAVVYDALTKVMRLSLTVGVIVIEIDEAGELSLETALTIGELMKRRAVAARALEVERRAA